jgi:cell division protein FtsL
MDLVERSVEGSAAKSLPSVERAPRPAAKPRAKKRSMGGVAAMSLGWVLVLALSLTVVHRNTLVLKERGEITALNEQIRLEELEVAERETQLARTQSMERVEEWAKANGMIRPTNIKAVAPDPTAVAVNAPVMQQQPAPAPAVAEAKGSFLESVKSYLERWQAARSAAAGK